LAAALGFALVENGWRVLFTRTNDLVQRLQIAHRELGLEAAIARLDKYHLLILDDLAYVTKDQAETSVLFELISARYERRSLLITANQPFGDWGKVFPDPAMTVAVVDRLRHNLRDECRKLPPPRRPRTQTRSRTPARQRDKQSQHLIDAPRQSNLAPVLPSDNHAVAAMPDSHPDTRDLRLRGTVFDGGADENVGGSAVARSSPLRLISSSITTKPGSPVICGGSPCPGISGGRTIDATGKPSPRGYWLARRASICWTAGLPDRHGRPPAEMQPFRWATIL
jgi:hypothetical protein